MAEGQIIQGVRWLRDAAGRLVGYRNPVTDKDEEYNFAAGQSLVSGAGNLSATLDGSNRLATLTNNSTGRSLTVTYADATHLTVRDNGAPQSEVAIVLDGGGRLVSATGNF